MSFLRRALPALLLALVAGGALGCDVEAWLRLVLGEEPPPAEPPRVAHVEPEPPKPALRMVLPAEDLDEPLRKPEPPTSPRSSFNRISSSSSSTAQGKPRHDAHAPPAAMERSVPTTGPREIQPGSDACERARIGAVRMQQQVESLEREIEQLEEVADDIDYTPRTRERYEARVDAAEARLEQAEDQLGDYIQNERQRGVPLGCLR